MKKLNTLKKIFTLALCAAVAAASFTSCSDGTENSADTAAVLTLSADGTSRSVLPSADLASLTSLSLTGTSDGGTVATLGTWSSYSDMTAAQIAVAPGTWSFTLNASNSGAALSGTVTGRTVTAGTNALSFSLEVSSYTQTSTGTGNIDVSLTYAPGSVAEVTAGLFTSDGTAVSGYGAETVTPTDSGTDKTASYTKSGVPSGTYVLIFKFYGGTGGTLFLNRWRESVTVADGLTSSSSVTVENLNTVYDIAYEYNGGSLKSGETATLSYVGKTGATLTAAEKVERTGYTFAGWYGDSAFSGSAVTEIAAGQSGKKTFYAKWTANVYYLTIDAQSGSCAYAKLYEKYDTGWYTDEACTNEITSDTVLTVPTRSGYAFMGIYGTTDGSGDCYITAAGKKTAAVTNTIISGNSVTLYAVWSNKYTITYSANTTDTVTGSMQTQTVTRGVATALTANTFVRSGYVFKGWATSTGGMAAYADGALVTDLATAGTSVTLYAVWSVSTVSSPADVKGAAALPVIITRIIDHLYLASSAAGTSGYIACWETSGASTYQWWTRTDGTSWSEVSGKTSSELQFTAAAGTVYYCLAATSSDGTSTAYSNVCTVECGTSRTTYIGMIYYTDKTVSSAYVSGKTPAGIVCDVKPDGSVKTIVALEQSSTTLEWAPSGTGYTTTFATSLADGKGNWAVIQAADPEGSKTAANYPAFSYCNAYTGGGYDAGTWYLPSRDELSTIYFNKAAINAGLNNLRTGSYSGTATDLGTGWYWSSSQCSSYYDGAWVVNFGDGDQEDDDKFNVDDVRSVAGF